MVKRKKPRGPWSIDGDSIEISGLPLPPSENNMYINIPGGGRAPSKGLRDHRKAVAEWSYSHAREIRSWRERLGREQPILVTLKVYFPYKGVFSKEGRVKRNDLPNREKAAWDSMSTILDLDDRFIFGLTAEKLWTDRRSGWCDITVTPITLHI